MGEEAVSKWLYRECCDSIVEVNKTYGQIEFFKCGCGRNVEGQYLKYHGTRESAVAARTEKRGGMPGMDDISSFMGG